MPRVLCQRVLPGIDAEPLYELIHESARSAVAPSRGPWTVTISYGDLAALEASLLGALGAAAAAQITPLSRLAPLRLGATGRPDVVAERSRGLCRYLEHALRLTEPPASPSLLRLVDAFVLRHCPSFASGARPTASLDVTSLPPRGGARSDGVEFGESSAATPWQVDADNRSSRFAGLLRPGEVMAPPLVNGFRRVLAAAEKTRAHGLPPVPAEAGEQVAQEATPKVWHIHGAAPTARPGVRHLLEPMPRSDASNALCPLCKMHLRKGAYGCFRLRSCGHEVHADCLNGLLRGGHIPGVRRSECAQCGECWAAVINAPGGTARGKEAVERHAADAERRQGLAALLESGLSARYVSGAAGRVLVVAD